MSERHELVLSAQKQKKEALAHSIEAKLEAAEAQRQVRVDRNTLALQSEFSKKTQILGSP